MASGPRILIARPDHLGDVLLSLPAATALRRVLPDAWIGFLVPAGLAAVPARCPDVDAVHPVPFPSLLAPLEAPDWRAARARAAARLRGCFDVVLLPRPDDPWTGPLVAEAGIPLRLGYAAPRTAPFLTGALPAPLTAPRHVAGLALDLAAFAANALGAREPVDREATPVRFVPTAADEVEAATVYHLLADPARLVLLHPGSGWPLKNWPARRWGVLAATLRQRYGLTAVVVGTPADDSLVAAVVAASGGHARPLPCPLAIGGLAAFQRRARLVIATDSGALHLATAVGTPVIGLYGPADPLEFGPWLVTGAAVARVSLPCSPCRTLLDPPCGARVEPACVTGITVEAVLAAAAPYLEVGRAVEPGVPVTRYGE